MNHDTLPFKLIIQVQNKIKKCNKYLNNEMQAVPNQQLQKWYTCMYLYYKLLVLKFFNLKQLAENQNYKYCRNKATTKLKEDLKNKNHDVGRLLGYC